MKASKLRTIEITQGNDFQLILARHKDKESGTPINLSGVTALLMDVREGTSMKSTLVERFTIGGGASIEVDSETGVADTFKFFKSGINWPAGILHYDIFVIDANGIAETWYKGEIIVRKSITALP